jgi:hypothetical protein
VYRQYVGGEIVVWLLVLFTFFPSEMRRVRRWVTEARQLIGNSIKIVDTVLNGDSSSGIWNENDEHPHVRQPLSHQNVMKLFQSPLKFLYYFYIWLPLFWFILGMEYLKLTLQVSARRSSKLFFILRQLHSFYLQGRSLSFFSLK